MSTVIEFISVSKKYRRYTRQVLTTLKSFFLQDVWRKSDNNKEYTLALTDISIKIDQGVTLGIIGRNGSGKSTMLKLISKIIKPDKGSVLVYDRVSSLIELGAGFHPELTGRENVIINGVILGLSKSEIKSRLDEIIDFSELREYIDDPVRTYSSGMYMRLGFSVAVHVDPKVLLIDEIFAVGDITFVKKCMDKMNSFKKAGKTIIIVSHDLTTISNWCDQAVWLDQGQMKQHGNSKSVVDSYVKSYS